MHLLLFDIDGTLISSGGAGKAALEAAAAEEFGINREIGKLDLSGRTDRAIVADMLRHFELEVSHVTARRLLDAYLRHLPTHLSNGRGLVLPGILELLDHCRGREGVALGLLTGNIRAGARIKLTHFGLWDYFLFGGFGDEHHDRDDVAREALREATDRWQEKIDPRRVWVIGDTPLDIRCARAIGANVVAVATGWHDVEELAGHGPDLLVSDLSDHQCLLERIGGA